MEEISFEVQGSASEPYRVDFVRGSKRNLSAYCSCPAGKNGQYCKHRFNILAGGENGIVSGNEHQVATVQDWLAGTDIEESLNTMRAIEGRAKDIKQQLSEAKRNVAKAMRD